MDYSLIANSGIQLLSTRITIDLNDGYKCRFYESFDDELFQWKLEFAYTLNSQMVLLTSELREKGYLDASNKLTTSEAVILANPEVHQFNIADSNEDNSGIFFSKLSSNNKILESYFNVWLPIPFIEMDETGDYKNGPYNWSKLMIIPRSNEAGLLTVDLLLAFDTHASYYKSDPYNECPTFMSEGEVEKHYRALAAGDWVNDRQHVKLPLFKYVTREGERRVRVDEENGLPAHSIFTLLRRYGPVSLLDVELKTGRTHQIRVHAASCGHPLVGDEKYGDYAFNREVARGCLGVPFRRMFLHSALLAFEHPVTHGKLRIEAPLPRACTDLLEALDAAKTL